MNIHEHSKNVIGQLVLAKLRIFFYYFFLGSTAQALFSIFFLDTTAQAHYSVAKEISIPTRKQPTERDIYGPLINSTPAVAAQVTS